MDTTLVRGRSRKPTKEGYQEIGGLNTTVDVGPTRGMKQVSHLDPRVVNNHIKSDKLANVSYQESTVVTNNEITIMLYIVMSREVCLLCKKFELVTEPIINETCQRLNIPITRHYWEDNTAPPDIVSLRGQSELPFIVLKVGEQYHAWRKFQLDVDKIQRWIERQTTTNNGNQTGQIVQVVLVQSSVHVAHRSFTMR